MAGADEGDGSGPRVGSYIHGTEPPNEVAQPDPMADAKSRARPVRSTSPHTTAGRPGPAVFDSDSWDGAPADDNGAYHGRRRAATPEARLWLVIALVLAGLAAAIAIPIGLSSWSTPRTSLPTRASDEAQAGLPTEPVGSISATGSPGTGPSATASAKPVATSTKAVQAVFSPLSYEAESGPSTRRNVETRTVAGASGGSVVDRIGEWGGKDGWVQFNVAVPSAGAYTVTVHYLFLESSDDPTRKARIILNGNAQPDVTFNRVTTCCARQAITLTLTAGANTIRFTHSQVRSPAIDRIVITKP